MKLKKLFVILLTLLVFFSFIACDGSGGGNGGGNEVTWPVRFRADNSEVEGAYFFIDFYDGTFTAGEGGPIEGVIVEIPKVRGTYTGDDPHGDGTISMSGTFGDTPFNGSFAITDGVLHFEIDMVRQ